MRTVEYSPEGTAHSQREVQLNPKGYIITSTSQYYAADSGQGSNVWSLTGIIWISDRGSCVVDTTELQSSATGLTMRLDARLSRDRNYSQAIGSAIGVDSPISVAAIKVEWIPQGSGRRDVSPPGRLVPISLKPDN